MLHIITHIDTLDQIWEMTHEFEFPNFDIKSNVDINTIEASTGRVTKGTITAAQKKSRKNPIAKIHFRDAQHRNIICLVF